MAENNQIHECTMAGCVYHIEAKASSGKRNGEEKIYPYRMHFKSWARVSDRLRHSANIAVAARANQNKPLPIRPNGEYLDIYDDLSFSKTVDDEVAEIAALPQEQKNAAIALLMKKVEALKALEEKDSAAQKKK